MKELNLKEIQKEELEILKATVKWFKKNNITYMLAYGTLLGAVRHKGFIPWDDDIDICVPRKDYEIMKSLAKVNPLIGEDYEMQVPGDKGYCLPFIKVVNKKIKVIDEMADPKYKRFLWIDIFPLDYLPEDRNLRLKIYNKSQKMLRVLAVGTKKKQKLTVLRIMGKILNSLYGGTRCICKKIDSYGKNIDKINRGSSYLGLICFPEKIESFVEKDMLFPLVKLPFESEEFYVPQNYDKYLTNYYGDYMIPLEGNDRVRHYIKAYLIEA